jgi:hypothetical protein
MSFIDAALIISMLFIIFMLFYVYNRDKYVSCKPDFKETLQDAKKLLDENNIKFHLHSGTALGAIRNKDFIKHDQDIDLAIFKNEYDDNIIEIMKKKFYFKKQYGTIDNGLELKFLHKKHNIGLDIFILYKKDDRLFQSVYHCKSDRFEKGTNSDDHCIMYMNDYTPIKIKFLGKKYECAPISFLKDRYGNDWNVPKVFTYSEGLNKHYGSL